MSRALMLIDVQRHLFEGEGAIPDAGDVLPRIAQLLEQARQRGYPVVHVQHAGDEPPNLPGTPGWELAVEPLDGEEVVAANSQNAFEENPDLDDLLKRRGVSRLVIAGALSERCVLETAFGALDLGFAVDLASGAHATYHGERALGAVSTAVERKLAERGGSIVWWRGALG